MTTWTWAEPFAGAAACTLRLVGGRDLAPPVAWMGGKRRYARAILDAMGVPSAPGFNTGQAARDGRGWRFDARPGDAAPDRERAQASRTGGMVNPCTIAERAEAIAEAFGDVDARVHHGDARDLLLPGEGSVFVLDDPPYSGATGYGWDLPRDLLLDLARRQRDTGAIVAVCEAQPLELDGWHHVDLTREGGKPEWLTLSRAPARLPERQGALFDEAP